MTYKKYYDYNVYEDGRVYSTKTNKFLKGDLIEGKYILYTLSIEGKPVRIRAHRLVATLFLVNPNPNNYNIVNHKDGTQIPLNNHYSNLEWCDCYYNNKHARDTGLNNISKTNSERWKDEGFRERVSSKISKTLIEKGIFKGKNNPKFRYLIKDTTGKEYSRQELEELLGYKSAFTYTIIRKAANGDVHKKLKDLNIIVIDTKNQSLSTIESIA